MNSPKKVLVRVNKLAATLIDQNLSVEDNRIVLNNEQQDTQYNVDVTRADEQKVIQTHR